MTRVLALAGAVMGVAGSAVSVLVVPWAHYGGIDVSLTWFPGWPVHLACVLALHVCVVWTLFDQAGHRIIIAAGATSGLTAGVSAIIIALQYDNPAALFDSLVVPAVMPRPGAGALIALFSIFAGGAAISTMGRSRATKPAIARPASGSV